MNRFTAVILFLSGFLFVGCESEPNITPTAAAQLVVPRVEPTSTLTPVPSSTPTATPTPTETPTPIPSDTPTPTLTPSATPIPTETLTPTPFFGPEPIEIGRSVENRPIIANRFGNGSKVVVLLGSLHSAYAPAGAEIATLATQFFTTNPQALASQQTLYIISDANPDSRGSVGSVSARLNANGVDLNRNWDCLWRSRTTFGNTAVSGGDAPFSEPESRALRDFFLQVKPEAVVIWTAQYKSGLASPGGCVDYSSKSQELADTYALAAGYASLEWELTKDGAEIHGDITNWLDDQGTQAIFVLLPKNTDADWNNTFLAIRAVLDSNNRQ